MVQEILKLESSWEFLQRTKLPIVLYGTGNGADKILDRFAELSIPLYGVAASDGFVRHRQFRGFTVRPISDFESELSDFVLAVGFGSDRPALSDYIKALSARHKLLFPCVPVYGDEVFDKAFLAAHTAEIEEVYAHLADGQSRLVYRSFLRFQIAGDFKDLIAALTPKDEAFQTILRLTGQEAYLDLGAYRGDTIAEFLHYAKHSYKSIVALEPNAKAFSKLTDYAAGLQNCTLYNAAVSNADGTLHFSGDGRRHTADRNGKYSVAARTVDGLFRDSAFTYIKADVEGLEAEMLRGAVQCLKKAKPKLNLAAYHKSADCFSLPLFLLEQRPDYQLYFRKHGGFPFWDFNLYAI